MTVTAIETHASTALAIRAGQQEWTGTQLAALTQLGIRDASDGDKAVFLHQCQRTGLDPFARQIYMIGRKEKRSEKRGNTWVDVYEVKWTIQTGIEGWRVIRDRAERRENVRVTVGRAIWYDHDGNELKVWVRPDPPAACEITITVTDIAGNQTPYTSVLQFREYVQTKESNNQRVPIAQWAVKPSHMLEKCTEADVYRKAFPQDFSGIYLDDAMPAPEPEPETSRNRGRVTAGEVLDRGPANGAARQAAAARDDTQAGPGPAPAGREDPQERKPGDPRAAGTASPRGAQPPATLLKVIADHFDRLGITEPDECLSWTSRLAGCEVTGPGQLTTAQAQAVAGALWKCDTLGDLTALLETGEKPGGDGDD